MGLSVVVAATTDPLTLAEAKAHLRVTSTDEDWLISSYIQAARDFVENSTHLKLASQTLDYTIDDKWPYVAVRGYCRTRIELPVKPLISVTSINYVDSSGATQTLSVSDYVVRSDGPVPFVEPAYGVTWPDVRWQTAAITVRFVAGYAEGETPAALLQVMRMLIAHADENREAVAEGIFVEVPLGVEGYLSPYRYVRL